MEGISWDDIKPIPQDDGPNPLVVIKYDYEFRGLMDIFRGVLNIGEKSERVLKLTESILAVNAANYTVWQYRRDCLRELNSDLELEFDYMDLFADDNPKNYQIWYHRRAIVEMSNDPTKELEFCAKVFEEDPKNYHAWSHRQWVLSKYGLWDGELEYIVQLLESDLRNNSAWNQRWFYVHHGPVAVNADVLDRELCFVFDCINIISLNESAWNYLRGLMKFHPETKVEILRRCEIFYQSNLGQSNILVIALLGDIKQSELTNESLLQAEELFSKLISLDKIRAKYWRVKVQRVQSLIK